MIARNSTIKHPNGTELQTPLFVFSFSSKGFRFKKKKKKKNPEENPEEYSEVVDLVKSASEYLSDTVLLSAYDLKYYFPEPKKMRKAGFVPKLVFLDSGGYETIEDHDMAEAYKYPVSINEWNKDDHEKVINSWPEYLPAVIISYDHGNETRRTFKQQVKNAKILFSKYPGHLNNFLIKPNKKRTMLNIQEIVDNAMMLKDFNIIGMAEKELGESIVDRMKNIKAVRSALDSHKISAPIHIFGNLDPLTSIMYFLAGAEIFDGLSWLRFGFHEGRAHYVQNSDAIRRRFLEKDYLNQRQTLVENIIYMRTLQAEMKAFLKEFPEKKEGAFVSCFKHGSEQLKDVYQVINS
jgi:hypothetical protein